MLIVIPLFFLNLVTSHTPEDNLQLLIGLCAIPVFLFFQHVLGEILLRELGDHAGEQQQGRQEKENFLHKILVISPQI